MPYLEAVMVEFGSWFDEDELERCPNCGKRRLIRAEGRRLRVCLDCGVIEIPDAGEVVAHGEPCEPSPEEEQEE